MLTKLELASFRQTLEALRREKVHQCREMTDVAAQLLHPRTSTALPDRPEIQGDSHNEEVEQEIDLALLENAEVNVHEIDAALQRLGAGTFGLCGVCTQPIAKERLRALPATRYCVRCAERVQ